MQAERMRAQLQLGARCDQSGRIKTDGRRADASSPYEVARTKIATGLFCLVHMVEARMQPNLTNDEISFFFFLSTSSDADDPPGSRWPGSSSCDSSVTWSPKGRVLRWITCIRCSSSCLFIISLLCFGTLWPFDFTADLYRRRRGPALLQSWSLTSFLSYGSTREMIQQKYWRLTVGNINKGFQSGFGIIRTYSNETYGMVVPSKKSDDFTF